MGTGWDGESLVSLPHLSSEGGGVESPECLSETVGCSLWQDRGVREENLGWSLGIAAQASLGGGARDGLYFRLDSSMDGSGSGFVDGGDFTRGVAGND